MLDYLGHGTKRAPGGGPRSADRPARSVRLRADDVARQLRQIGIDGIQGTFEDVRALLCHLERLDLDLEPNRKRVVNRATLREIVEAMLKQVHERYLRDKMAKTESEGV